MTGITSQTLIGAEALAGVVGDPDWCVIDARYDLADPVAGRRAYEQAHVPGALYADLEEDLSGPPVTDAGRHPMLDVPAMRARMKSSRSFPSAGRS